MRRRTLLLAPALLVPALALPGPSAGAAAAPAAPAAAALPAAALPAAALPTSAGLPAAPAASTPGKHAVAVGKGGAVAAETVGASRAGLKVLRGGGNAVDAAVATAAALGVDDPYVAGPGGGGFMVIYLARTKQVVTIDGRETCPDRCTLRLFLDAQGAPLDFELARHSGISVGVPGMVAQWAKATELYGRRTLQQDLRPAASLARTGFRVDQHFHDTTQRSLAQLRTFTPSRRLFLRDGQPLPVGSLFRNPDLARTYDLLGEHGPAYLYRGPLGQAIARTVRTPPVARRAPAGFTVLPGIMTTEDLRRYEARSRPPTHVVYRGLDVFSMAPPSSGGTTVGEALNILSGLPLGAEDRTQALFHYLEASRLAFADRNAYVGDSDYEPVPIGGLLDPAFAATRRCLIGSTALQSPVAPGDPFAPYADPCTPASGAAAAGREGKETNHLVTSDRWGNVVSYTNTIEQLAGSGMTVPGHGFLLNNEMTDFDFAPSAPGSYDPNLPAPGKRPRSSMSPTIVLRSGRPFLAVGSPGGSTIITTVLQTLLNRIDLGMTLPQAIAAPRASQRNSSLTDVEKAFAQGPYAGPLATRYGERFGTPTDAIGFVNALEFLGGGFVQAANEPTRLGGGNALVVQPRR